MKTIRRDKLLRLAQAGGLISTASYHYDDMHGADRRETELPVRVAAYGDFKDGFCNLPESDFRSCSGCAYENDDGTISLHVHGNCSYTFKTAAGFSLHGETKTPTAKRPENTRMQAFLASNGIDAVPKYLPDGSMAGCWRLYNRVQKWSLDLAARLNGLGFTDFDGQPLGEFSGNGGSFQVFVRGHNELLTA